MRFKKIAASSSLLAGALVAGPVYSQLLGGVLDPLLSIAELPDSPLKEDLSALSEDSLQTALNWLNEMTFPLLDADHLRSDSDGGIYYVDPFTGENASSVSADSAYGLSESEVFTLHSKPGARNTLYIDFDGHEISGTAWNSGAAPDRYVAKAYDLDGNPSAFNEIERDNMAEIWHRLAEDYAAFDIDVTTELPANFGPNTARVLITFDEDVQGIDMPAKGAGGVAYVNVFGRSDFQYYQPALVYADNLGPTYAPYIAEASAHEMGHNLGLSHDGSVSSAYYSGHGAGFVSWAPIMGSSYNENVTQWSAGEYDGANNPQDDIAIIAEKLGRSSDDHSSELTSASILRVDSNGGVSASSAQSDPFNVLPENKGVIGALGDVDLFKFSSGQGSVDISVTPSWAAWSRDTGGRGTNLDLRVALLNSDGQEMASDDPVDNTDARVTVSVGAGEYFLAVSAVGSAMSPYSDYASQGQYYISGQIPVPLDSRSPPESPSNMTVQDGADGTALISWRDNSASEEGFRLERESWNSRRNTWKATTIVTTTAADVSNYVDASGTGIFRYRALSFNSEGNSVPSEWAEVTVTSASGGGGGGGCKGGPKKCS